MIAKANTGATVDRLTVAGARHMAAYVLRPNVAWALSELPDEKSKDMTTEESAIAPGSSYVGRTIGEVGLRQHGVEVMAIGRDGGQQFLPAREETTRPLDVLVMIEPPPYVQRLADRAGE